MQKLTPAMEAARAVIQHNEVTYRYRPMRRSVNRPQPVTSRDLTPLYSHSLNARTVEALISRGLARLAPHDQNHGRVLNV